MDQVLLITSVVLAVAALGSVLGGGRRWRSNFEAERDAHLQTKTLLAAAEALVQAKEAIIEGQGERLKRLDEMLQRAGGAQVYEQLLLVQQQNLQLFTEVLTAIEKSEERMMTAMKATMTEIRNGH